jgi:hypothetical protein
MRFEAVLAVAPYCHERLQAQATAIDGGGRTSHASGSRKSSMSWKRSRTMKATLIAAVLVVLLAGCIRHQPAESSSTEGWEQGLRLLGERCSAGDQASCVYYAHALEVLYPALPATDVAPQWYDVAPIQDGYGYGGIGSGVGVGVGAGVGRGNTVVMPDGQRMRCYTVDTATRCR